MKRLLPFACVLLLPGCMVASTAVDVATAPVKIAAKGVDLATTSQAEADRNRGRALRELEDRCRRGKPRPGDDCARLRPR